VLPLPREPSTFEHTHVGAAKDKAFESSLCSEGGESSGVLPFTVRASPQWPYRPIQPVPSPLHYWPLSMTYRAGDGHDPQHMPPPPLVERGKRESSELPAAIPGRVEWGKRGQKFVRGLRAKSSLLERKVRDRRKAESHLKKVTQTIHTHHTHAHTHTHATN